MSSARVGILPHGSRGFDANTRVSLAAASAFWSAGYRYAVRYVRRTTPHDYDLSTTEVLQLLRAGLGLMVVQHVTGPDAQGRGWIPTSALGAQYGETAADECRKLGLPKGIAVWCDLEGVRYIGDRPAMPAEQVIGFCNAWFDAVKAQGYDPGLYVGYDCGLTGEQLYWKTKFRRFWSAYNLNADSVPVKRGVCQVQLAYPPATANERTVQKYMDKYQLSHAEAKSLAQRVIGVSFEYDVDLIQRDGFNNLPAMLLPGDPG